jgi:hypothetical protein
MSDPRKLAAGDTIDGSPARVADVVESLPVGTVLHGTAPTGVNLHLYRRNTAWADNVYNTALSSAMVAEWCGPLTVIHIPEQANE